MCNAVSGTCEAQPSNTGGTCNDGDLCTQGDQCIGVLCIGSPLNCSALNGQCTAGVCNASGTCEAQPSNTGGTCNDGNPASFGDICVQGVCRGVSAGAALRIDEVVTDPQSDWSDGSGAPFDTTPGSGTVNADDEYIEIRNTGSIPFPVRDLVVRMIDAGSVNYVIGSGGGAVEVYSAGSDADLLLLGGILVIGNPPGEMDNDIAIEIVFGGPTGFVLSDVQLGGFGAPSGVSTGPADEAVRRVSDTGDDSTDFTRGPGDPGIATGP